ncbi:MAG: LamG domain-containing protein [Candidatus Micrarchaeota archaeon]|nr:LamG domain-containing protein [Candidatus Micrarchaeota archaeon]
MPMKSQSAMEYLMTYGWAILAIAIVMVSLYSLGIFNVGTLQPTATPGSCQVVRTAAQISLAGQCNNLMPRYVAKFPNTLWPGKAVINVSGLSSWNPSGNVTVTLFVYSTNNYNTYGGPYPEILYKGTTGQGFDFESRNNNESMGIYGTTPGGCTETGSHVKNVTWHQFVGVYNGSYYALYINGVKIFTCAATGLPNLGAGPFYLGAGGYYCSPGLCYGYTGYLSNVQIYNTSLDSATIKALYQEGIGGAPIDVRHLIAWWPLNGNGNDYSGNNYHGIPVNVIWSSNWYSTYKAPTS